MRYYLRVLFTLMCIDVALAANGQSTADREVWVGYIGSVKLNERWSLWNDFHYVPTAFWANRHGLTYNLGSLGNVSGGYAFVLTATSFTEKLRRQEHRPWWQYEVIKPIGHQFGWRARLRYDRRIRQGLTSNDFTGDWIAYNRWRLMLSLRWKLKDYGNGQSLHLNLLNEILVNNGQQYNGNWLDQNRSYLMLSYHWEKVRIQFGPHLRAIPSSSDYFNYRYGITCWVIHRCDAQKYWPQP